MSGTHKFSFVDTAIGILFIVLTLSCIFILFSAYSSLAETNRTIEIVLKELKLFLLNNPPNSTTQDNIVSAENVLLAKIDQHSKGTLDSNTISFLFQVFAICLVSAGVYLFSQTHKDYKRIKLASLRQNTLNISINLIKSLLDKIYFLSWIIKNDNSNRRLGMIVQMRKYTNELYNLVNQKDMIQNDFKNNITVEIIDLLGYCKSNLRFRNEIEYEIQVSDIIQRIESLESYFIRKNRAHKTI